MKLTQTGQRLQAIVDTLAFGGEGIVRHNGLVIFVPFAAPGDQIELEITESKKRFARGKIIRVLAAAENRISARCPHFGVCGGCQLQHLNYDKQLEYKNRWVSESLNRIGKFSSLTISPTIGASVQWEYRRVVKLRFRMQDNELLLGYVDAESRSLMSINKCPIFHDDENFYKDLKKFLHNCVQSIVTTGFFSLFKHLDGQFVALLEIENAAPQQLLERCKKLPLNVKGIAVAAQSKTYLFGDTSLKLHELGLNFGYTPMCFVQNHAEQSRKILENILSTILALKAKTVLDLYCGFGVSAISLAQKGLNVIGVESNLESIRLARQNAQDNNVQASFICSDVADFIEKGIKEHKPDVIIVNPPRVGLSPRVCEVLADSSVESIIYVSCMPQTLARDLAILKRGGYSIEVCQPYDMFPQTTHVETFIVLRRLR